MDGVVTRHRSDRPTRAYADVGMFRRLVRRTAATRPMTWLCVRAQQPMDGLAYELTGGRTTVSSLMSGLPVVLLTTIGAKTGTHRTLPVLGFVEGDRLVVIASNYGRPHHPGLVPQPAGPPTSDRHRARPDTRGRGPRVDRARTRPAIPSSGPDAPRLCRLRAACSRPPHPRTRTRARMSCLCCRQEALRQLRTPATPRPGAYPGAKLRDTDVDSTAPDESAGDRTADQRTRRLTGALVVVRPQSRRAGLGVA